MIRWRSPALFLLILSLSLFACSYFASRPPLPTRISTAQPLAGATNLEPGPRPTLPVQPTRPIPTASPTSPPTPTTPPIAQAEALGTAVGDLESFRATLTPLAEIAADSGTSASTSPTPAIVETPTPMPSITPTAEPTTVPLVPTTSPTDFPFPKAPQQIWPSPTPHNFPLSTVPRHGVGVAWGGAAQGSYGFAPYSWTFGWNNVVPTNNSDIQHVPLLAGSPRSSLPILSVLKERDAMNDHDYWLVFNECEHQGQCNTSPPAAAQFFHDVLVDMLFVQGGDPNAKIIIGGVNAHPCGIVWLKNFVDYYRVTYGELPVVGWHFHLYPEMEPGGWPNNCNGTWGFNDWNFPDPETAFNLWRSHAENTLAFVQEYGRPDDEIWFTEMGCLNSGNHQVSGPICPAEGFMQDYAGRILGWLNSEGRWVTRYAWYTNWDHNYWRSTHLIAEAPTNQQFTYSSLGYWYSQIIPAAAIPLPGFE